MNRNYYAIILCCLLLFALGCGNSGRDGDGDSSSREAIERKGQELLTAARALMAQDDYAGARDAVKRMRKECRMALNAREDGIILLDSIELVEARRKLVRVDSLMRVGQEENPALKAHFDELVQRIKFYQRKLTHDQKNKKIH